MTAKILLMLIRVYQLTLSPLVGGSCRFEPSCSVYASEAIRMHGSARGSWLAVKRLARCHPFGSYGFDPVPAHSPAAAHSRVPPRSAPGTETPAQVTEHPAPITQHL